MGVWIGDEASNNLIGGNNATPAGSCSGACNLISGSNEDGVTIVESGTASNTVSGNYIGTDATGTSKLGNAGFGILIVNGAAENLIGGSSSGERNLISGNIDGIYIGDSGTMSNTVKGNYIGTDVTGTADLGNQDVGISIQKGAAYNLIGGDNAAPGGPCSGDCNLISGNGEWGIFISDTSPHHNTVSGNYIGTNVSGTAWLANGSDGILMRDGTHHNFIGGETPAKRNLISGNSRDGIRVAGSTSLYNTLQQNAIYNNNGRGIELMEGGNTELSAPVISDCDLSLGTANGTACPLCKIEIFSDDENEGQYYEGSTTADAGGNWTFDKGSSFNASHCTATATDTQGNTSEFSPPCFSSTIYLPILFKNFIPSTVPPPTGPEPGYYSGTQPTVSLDVTQDQQVCNFDITVPFGAGQCRIRPNCTQIIDNEFRFDLYYPDLGITDWIEGTFDTPTHAEGDYKISICGNQLVIPPSQDSWEASKQ
jgi:hypothetical protein